MTEKELSSGHRRAVTHEFLVVQTACTGPSQAHPRQNPSRGRGVCMSHIMSYWQLKLLGESVYFKGVAPDKLTTSRSRWKPQLYLWRGERRELVRKGTETSTKVGLVWETWMESQIPRYVQGNSQITDFKIKADVVAGP